MAGHGNVTQPEVGVRFNVEPGEGLYADLDTTVGNQSDAMLINSTTGAESPPPTAISAAQVPSSSSSSAPPPKRMTSFRNLVSRHKNSTVSVNGLALFDDDEEGTSTLTTYLGGYIVPGATEKEASDAQLRRRKLGVILGVYLPTIQHIFGVIMFLRVFWIVGTAGFLQTFFMVFLCCLCTFLTSISMSAIATNGVVESGGSYFMISRNLGPEFGSAVGILFYLANAVAVAMYLVGGVEILLTFIAPDLPHFENQFNSFRTYGTALLVIQFLVVSLGVRFVQFFAPISLSCVIVSILAVFAGAFAASPSRSPMVCMLGGKLLRYEAWHINGTSYCTKDETVGNQTNPMWERYCTFQNDSSIQCMKDFIDTEEPQLIPGFPGFASGIFLNNTWSNYLKKDEATNGRPGTKGVEVVQDLTTSFFILLAIYFPSVTGIMTGSNMSGDLKDPQKSIPSGTLAAQLTTSFVYLSFVVLFAGAVHPAVLKDKYGESLNGAMVTAELAWPHRWVLLIGSFTSTFGAGLQCLCSAPRLLQSIAKDNVIPILSPFSVVNRWNEPFRALCVTTLISLGGILVGTIDHIAPIVDFFFLMCYCFVNIVCALQTLMHAPNWRPRFRFFHWSLSLLGALLCLFIMFATHWYYALVVIVLCASIYKYVDYRGAKKEWGDGIRGLALSTAQYSLMKIEDTEPHPKNWRPQLLVLMKPNDEKNLKYRQMLTLASQLKAGKGLTIVSSLMIGDYGDPEDHKRANELKASLKQVMKEEKVKGFAMVVLCEYLWHSVKTLIQSAGIGGLRPNTLLVGWPYGWKERVDAGDDTGYARLLDAVHRVATTDLCVLIPKGVEDWPGPDARMRGTIDVWWIMHDGGLLILLPFLLRQHKQEKYNGFLQDMFRFAVTKKGAVGSTSKLQQQQNAETPWAWIDSWSVVWRQCKLRVFAVAQIHDNSVQMKKNLEKWCYQLRIEATVDVVELSDRAVSAYAYERTLRMEERSRLARNLHLSMREEHNEPQLLLDQVRTTSQSSLPDQGHSGQPAPPSQQPVARCLSTPGNTGSMGVTSPARSDFTKTPVSPKFSVSTVKSENSTPDHDPRQVNTPSPVLCLLTEPDIVITGSTASRRQSTSTPSKQYQDTRSFATRPNGNVSSASGEQVGLMERGESADGDDDEDENDNESPAPEIANNSTNLLSASVRPSPSEKSDEGLEAKNAARNLYTFTPAALREEIRRAGAAGTGLAPESRDSKLRASQLDRKKVKKMHTAVQLNTAILERSGSAQLVVLNLPRAPKRRAAFENYLEYLEALTDGLSRVLLVRGSGKEVITIYS